MAKAQEAPTAAEEQLAQRDVDVQSNLEQEVKEQKQSRRAQLKASRKAAAKETAVKQETPSTAHRSDHVQFNSASSPERPDQYTIENPHEEVAYGHFCTYTGPELEVMENYVLNTGDFGVYVDNVVGTEDGSAPLQVRFRRREDLAVFVVDYDDLAPAGSRGNAPR